MVSTVRGKKLLPVDVFGNFIAFLPLISPSAMSWSFFLVTLFFHATILELQEAVQLGGYIFPDISTLTSFLLQE